MRIGKGSNQPSQSGFTHAWRAPRRSSSAAHLAPALPQRGGQGKQMRLAGIFVPDLAGAHAARANGLMRVFCQEIEPSLVTAAACFTAGYFH